MSKILFLLVFSLLLIGCSAPPTQTKVGGGMNKNSFRYEVVDSFIELDKGQMLFTVYTPDTNWTAMQKYAEKLIEKKTNEAGTVVAFFNPRTKTPKFDKVYSSIGKECMNNGVATYRYNKLIHQFELQKGKDRLTNKKMHFDSNYE